jgi:hypothetical protein
MRVLSIGQRLFCVRARAVFAACLLGIASAASANVNFVNSRPALGGNDFVDWNAALGPLFTSVPNPSNFNSNNGLPMSVSMPGVQPFQRLDQNNGWGGNFAPGDALLFTNFSAGPITITFSQPVTGAGAQIQQNQYGAFTATLQAFDSLGNPIGNFNGTSNGNADNSAIFVGALSDSANISSIVFSVPGNPSGFAINRLDIVGVPEPATLGLLALAAPAILRRRRH